MKLEKLPSGSYRVQKMIDGKRYSLTFDHRPTQKDIAAAIQKKANAVNGKMTFQDAALSYIDARTNTISPSTLREYKGTLKRLSNSFLYQTIDDITQNDVQKEINQLSKDRAAKTVRNYHGFIASVLAEFRPELLIRTKLPQKEKKEVYIPSSEEIKKLLEYAKGTQYETALYLGCASMRRSEICALTKDDIEGNIIHITKAMVMDENKNWVVKLPKTVESTRNIVVPNEVIEVINRVGLYEGHPNSITDWMDATEKKLNMKHFSFHKLRHYFASQAHESGASDADIMKAGGWKTDYVMKAVYRHSLADDTSAVTSAVFDKILP